MLCSGGVGLTTETNLLLRREAVNQRTLSENGSLTGAQFFFFFLPRMPPLRKSPAPRTKPKLYQVPLLWTS
jgi:hypothetical protein